MTAEGVPGGIKVATSLARRYTTLVFVETFERAVGKPDRQGDATDENYDGDDESQAHEFLLMRVV